MSLKGTCGCKDAAYTWPHYATPKCKCPTCNEWIAWTINRTKTNETFEEKLERAYLKSKDVNSN